MMKPFALQIRNQLLGFVREPVAATFNLAVPFMIVIVQALAYGDQVYSDGHTRYRLVDTLGVTTGVMFIMIIGLFGMGIGLASLIESRVLAGSSLRPGGPGLVMSAYALVLLVLVLLGWAISYLVLWLGWRATPPALPLAVLGVATLGIAVFLVLGVCIAAVAGTPRSTQGVCSMVFFPLLFLSGAIFPISTFPDALRAVAVWLPGYRLMEALSPLWADGQRTDLGSVLYLVAALVLAAILAHWLLRRREDV